MSDPFAGAFGNPPQGQQQPMPAQWRPAGQEPGGFPGAVSPFPAVGAPQQNMGQQQMQYSQPYAAQPQAFPQTVPQPMAQPPMPPQPAANPFMVPQPLAAQPAVPTMDVSQLDAAFNPPPAPQVGLVDDDLFAGLGPPAAADDAGADDDDEADADDVELEEGETPVSRALWPSGPLLGDRGQGHGGGM